MKFIIATVVVACILTMLTIYSQSTIFLVVSTPPKMQTQTQFQFYKQAIQWPPGVCRNKRCKTTPSIFTMHGLWPSRDKTKGPDFCKPFVALDAKEISTLAPSMNAYWPSLTGTNSKFWEHEWEKHGNCSNLEQLPYFELAMRLYFETNITKTLESEGIVPTNTQAYPIAQINAAVSKQTKHEPQLVCDGKGYLVEIRLCLTLTETHKDCPLPRSNCPYKVYLAA